jgi:hypothetical protein
MRIVDTDGGIRTEFHINPGGETFTINRVQDVETLLKHNRHMRDEDGYSPSRELKRFASVPLVVLEQWMKEDGVNSLLMGAKEKGEYYKKKLADPRWKHLLTAAKPSARNK